MTLDQLPKIGDPVYFTHWRGVVIRLWDHEYDDAEGDMVDFVTIAWDDGSGFTSFRVQDLPARRLN